MKDSYEVYNILITMFNPKTAVRNVLRPYVRQFRETVYDFRFRRGLRRLQLGFGERVIPTSGVSPQGAPERIWEDLLKLLPGSVSHRTLSLADYRDSFQGYWRKHGSRYHSVGHGTEKALEHALTFELFDFSRVRRYCDIAAAKSPIEGVFKEDWQQVERWKQDYLYTTDLNSRIIGGMAQKMDGIPDGFFDALSLHCSYEHFFGAADGEFVLEVDRVLSGCGACLIVPLYLDSEHRIYLDPTVVKNAAVGGYDPEARLCAAHGFRQEHGRYYSPKALCERVLSRIPGSLRGTVIRFTDQHSISAEIYLRFGLVLHRENSIFRGTRPN